MTRIDKWDIMFISAAYFGTTVDDVRGKSREYKFMHPRQIAMYLCRELTDYSTVEIGVFFHRDHTTIIHGASRMVEKGLSNPDVAYDISQVRNGVLTLMYRDDVPANPFDRREYLAAELDAAHLMQRVAAYIAHERGKPIGNVRWGGRSVAKIRKNGTGLDKRRPKLRMMKIDVELHAA